MATRLTPDEIADKLISRAGNAVEDVVKGIEGMTETPGVSAIKKKEKYRAGVLKSLDDGTWDAGHQSYSLADFKTAAVAKVRERYASGIAGAREKIVRAQTQLAAHRQKIQTGLSAMPSDTEQQREARMLYNKREMAKFKLAKPRR